MQALPSGTSQHPTLPNQFFGHSHHAPPCHASHLRANMTQAALSLQHNLSQITDPGEGFNTIAQKVDALVTALRINQATAKLQMIANGNDPDCLQRQQLSPDSQLFHNFDNHSHHGGSSLSQTASSPRRSMTPDRALTPQRLYFRRYFQNLGPDAYKPLSPTPSPPPEPVSWPSKPEPERLQRRRQAGPQPVRNKRRSNTKGRITKSKGTKHAMITRSHTKSGQKFHYLVMSSSKDKAAFSTR